MTDPSDPSDWCDNSSGSPQGQLPELHQKLKMELGGVDVSGYDGQLSPAPAHLLVTEGERTTEGALSRFRTISKGALEKFHESIALGEDPWRAAIQLRNACESAALEYKRTLTRIKLSEN
jgi:hypothetical protein